MTGDQPSKYSPVNSRGVLERGRPCACSQTVLQRRAERTRCLPCLLNDFGDGAGAHNASAFADVDGAAIAKAVSTQQSQQVVANLFATATQCLTEDADRMATMACATTNCVARRLLKAENPERHTPAFREELLTLIRAYLVTCVAPREPDLLGRAYSTLW